MTVRAKGTWTAPHAAWFNAWALFGIGLMAGTIAVASPSFALLIPVAGALVLALLGPGSRLASIVFLGLLALGSSASLDIPKLAFLLFAMVAMSTADVALYKSGGSALRKRILLPQAFLLAAVVVGATVGAFAGQSASDVLRDSAPYVLLAGIAAIAWDTGRYISDAFAERLLIAAGLFGAVGFTIDLIQQRGLSSVPLPDLILPSQSLAIALWAYALSKMAWQGFSLTWASIGAISVALPLVTGTRSTLILVAAPAVVLIIAIGRRNGRAIGRSMLAALVSVGLVSVALVLILASGLVDSSVVLNRLSTVPDAIADPGSIASLEDRASARDLAWDSINESPLVGVGLAYKFNWRREFGVVTVASTLDTTLVTPAKLGIIGTVAVATVVASWLYLAREPSPWRDALAVFLMIALARAFLVSVFEDKGFTLALMLLLAGSITFSRRRTIFVDSGVPKATEN